MGSIRIALAQVNPMVGDLEGNRAIVERAIEDARRWGADVVAAPELVLTGYPPEDLVLRPSFVADNLESLQKLAPVTHGIAAVVGFIDRDGDRVFNAAALISDGEIRGVYHKHLLPNYGVFDEERYFGAGEGILLGRLGDVTLGITICEDVWKPEGPHAACAAAGADIVININGSPYHRGKGRERVEMLARRARDHGVAFAYVNMVGGQDELVFDGQSSAVARDGTLFARASQFDEELLVFDFEAPGSGRGERSAAGGGEAVRVVALGEASEEKPEVEARIASEFDPAGEVYAALVLGVRDYLRKNGFEEALVGLSGGIDSSVTAAIATDALGPLNVLGVLNPGEYTLPRSVEDAEQVARNLGIQTLNLPIDDAYQALLETLDPVFAGTEWNVAEENLQSRIRGVLWMAISNKSEGSGRRRIVLSTGNKSEMACGYATLYGDMAGGFAVLKDVPKTLVYELARWRNDRGEVIPTSVLERPPSAELRPGQLDTDALPHYEVLDPILEAYVEDDRSPEEIIEMGFDAAVVRRVVGLVDRAEYKRRQTPPGMKITERAFGRDRRLPITNRYRPFEA